MRTFGALGWGLALCVLVACSSEAGDDKGNVKGATTAPPASTATVSVAVAVEGTAHVRSEPAGIDCPGTCEASFEIGARVKLVSVPAEGWKLDAWSGACEGKDACEIPVSGAATVKATYSLLDPRWDPAVGEADCRDAWGNAGEGLSPCDKTPDDYVVVHKSKRNLALCNNGKVVKNVRVGLGFTPAGDKEQQGDGKTPEGVFFIPTLLPDSDYHLAYLLSYPSKDDAARGASQGIISRQEADAIIAAHDNCTEPSQSTNLGGAVEIHGEGSSKDWTAGCIALENTELDEIWKVVGLNDTIVVLP